MLFRFFRVIGHVLITMQDIKIDHLVVIPFDSSGLFAVYGDWVVAQRILGLTGGPVTDKNDFPRRYIADPLHALTVDVAEPGSGSANSCHLSCFSVQIFDAVGDLEAFQNSFVRLEIRFIELAIFAGITHLIEVIRNRFPSKVTDFGVNDIREKVIVEPVVDLVCIRHGPGKDGHPVLLGLVTLV